jgi:hypothetical protein
MSDPQRIGQCHTCPPRSKNFKRIAEARKLADGLFKTGRYLQNQIGVFADDLGEGGPGRGRGGG